MLWRHVAYLNLNCLNGVERGQYATDIDIALESNSIRTAIIISFNISPLCALAFETSINGSFFSKKEL